MILASWITHVSVEFLVEYSFCIIPILNLEVVTNLLQNLMNTRCVLRVFAFNTHFSQVRLTVQLVLHLLRYELVKAK